MSSSPPEHGSTGGPFGRLRRWLGGLWRALTRFLGIYRPSNLRAHGLWWSLGVLTLTAFVLLFALGTYWSREPSGFDVREAALQMAQGDASKLVPGYVTTSTLIRIAETLLDKPGGYLSNDVMPPATLFGLYRMLDNMPNWEFGALVMLRDSARVLRNDFSRSQSQSLEDPDLAEAEPRFNFANDAWLFPPSERQYRLGIRHLRAYLSRLSSESQQSTQFYARADNLNELFGVVEKRLGGLAQRLNASVAEVRVNVDLAGDRGARQATPSSARVVAVTPWMQIDDVFYEARGYVWALLEVLRAIEVDFRGVLEDKNAIASLEQVIRLLEPTLESPSSPVVLNGDPLGWVANYSKAMVSYVSPANAAIINLRSLLARG